MMNNEITTIVDIANGTQTERPLTEAELAERELDKVNANNRATSEAQRIAARQAVLDKLGLTADEAAALLG
jgi:hypothetical protein